MSGRLHYAASDKDCAQGAYENLILNHQKYFDKKKKYYIYCAKGVKSKRVTAILEAYGYNVTRVTD